MAFDKLDRMHKPARQPNTSSFCPHPLPPKTEGDRIPENQLSWQRSNQNEPISWKEEEQKKEKKNEKQLKAPSEHSNNEKKHIPQSLFIPDA